MRSSFQKIVDQMDPLFQALLASPPHTVENGLRNLLHMRPLIRERGAESSRQGTATFAYKLTLEAVGKREATPRSSPGRSFKRGMGNSTRGRGKGSG